MLKRKMLVAVLVVMFAVAVVPYLFVTKPAHAQETGVLLSRIAELTYRKGFYIGMNPDLAKKLGMSPETKVYFISFGDRSLFHSLQIYKDHNGDNISMLVRDGEVGHFYLTNQQNRDRLLLVLKGTKNGKSYLSSWDTIPTEQGLTGYKQELFYWKTQGLHELVNSIDRCSDQWNAEYPSARC